MKLLEYNLVGEHKLQTIRLESIEERFSIFIEFYQDENDRTLDEVIVSIQNKYGAKSMIQFFPANECIPYNKVDKSHLWDIKEYFKDKVYSIEEGRVFLEDIIIEICQKFIEMDREV